MNTINMIGIQILLVWIVLLDGFFHLLSVPDVLRNYSPDWVLADGLFEAAGMPPWVHRVMGIFLIAFSGYVLYLYYNGLPMTAYAQLYIDYLVPFAIAVISAGVLFKLFAKHN